MILFLAFLLLLLFSFQFPSSLNWAHNPSIHWNQKCLWATLHSSAKSSKKCNTIHNNLSPSPHRHLVHHHQYVVCTYTYNIPSQTKM
jgi:hypothetical protein